jgi:hypothetical protein
VNEQPKQGISRQGLDTAFEAEEATKSQLLVEAQLLRAQHQPDEAASRFAQAAEIEQRLAAACEAQGLLEKAWVHHFSAVSCWAQAGNFHEAITRGAGLLAHPNLPARLRLRVEEYIQALRLRRAQWSAGLVLAPSSSEV